MAIQMRRGALADYDKDKMLAGEIAVTTDNDTEDQQVYVAFGPGVSKRVLTETDVDDIEAAAADVKNVLGSVENILPVTWESGAINSNTGETATSSERLRTNLFSVDFPYLMVKKHGTSSFIIEVYRYNTDGTYVDYQSNNTVYDGFIVGYKFDTSHKYRIVSRNITDIITFVGIRESDAGVFLGVGTISNGTFSHYATHTATIKDFSVKEKSILVINEPNLSTIDLCYYSDGTYQGKLSYSDTNNNICYFPLDPIYTYRLYLATESYSSLATKISTIVGNRLFVGGIYNGQPIASTGNQRTNLINANLYKYVKVWCSVTCYVRKFKNGVYTSSATAYSGVFSPATVDISDCDFFYILANDNNEIKYELTNDASLYGKKWCSYGDSITEQQKWQNYLVAKFGLVLSNKGLGGSCVTGDTANSVTPMTDSTRINSIDTDTDIITVMGGTNDFDYCTDIGEISDLQISYDDSTFIGSVATIVKKLQTRCPNARIILMSNVNSRGTTGQNSDNQPVSTYGYTPYDFAVAMKQAAEWLSVGYIDIWSCGINQLNRSTYVSDTVHPNDAGGRMIARKVISFFNNMEYF